MSTLSEFFDQRAPAWDEYSTDSEEVILRLLSATPIQGSQSVLDLGCGTGVLTPILAKLTQGQILGIDLSKEMIIRAKSKNPCKNRAEFLCEDFYGLEGVKFDHIVCYNAFPHFLDVEGYAKKASELLNEGGYLTIIHDRGRAALDCHHSNVDAFSISRKLLPVEEQAKPFLPYFEKVLLSEDDSHYRIVLRRE